MSDKGIAKVAKQLGVDYAEACVSRLLLPLSSPDWTNTRDAIHRLGSSSRNSVLYRF